MATFHGSNSYYKTGGSVRLPGKRGFQAYNEEYVRKYMEGVVNAEKKLLSRTLPRYFKSFLKNNLTMYDIPWDTGNLHDSFVASMSYTDYQGKYCTVGPYRPEPPAATAIQKWGAILGGMGSPDGNHFKGWGKNYAQNLSDDISDDISFGDIDMVFHDSKDKNNVTVFFGATIPYAAAVNDNTMSFEAGWFDEISKQFIDGLRGQVKLSCRQLETYSQVGDDVFYGINTQFSPKFR